MHHRFNDLLQNTNVIFLDSVTLTDLRKLLIIISHVMLGAGA